jgi:branched-chain amino acid transport system permease protein
MSTREESGTVLPSVRLNRSTVVLVAGLVLLTTDLGRRLATGDVAVSTLATFLWDGIVFGMAVGLAGIGLAMTYSILQFANFAHGDYVTAGAFAGWVAAFVVAGAGSVGLDSLVLVANEVPTGDIGITVFPKSGISSIGLVSFFRSLLAVLVGLVVASASSAGLALALDRVVFKPMRDARGISLLIASVGVALALRHALIIVFTGSTRSLTTDVATQDIPVGNGSVSVGAHEVTLIVIAGGLMLSTHLLLRYTKLGTAMRAMADNENLALVTGIPTERVVRTTWLVGGALTGAAGFLIALESGTMDPTFGWDLLLLVFSAVILGGIGSVYGAIVGGIVIGIASRLSLVWLPSELVLVGAFAVLVLMLLVRPQGLLGGVKTV